ncbi:hypothetical protein E2562_035156 [Oryza meyeriana var. granulata]|uniref:DUF834 domain-containing protein n=1 Tax=Oryza meyeriana var. granulata TaxID=110450 RepID=A0A6G1E7N0_9ORYZ|nr:hypothetical protein E2562_035156 [Oryza meyeriana var. granulata]
MAPIPGQHATVRRHLPHASPPPAAVGTEKCSLVLDASNGVCGAQPSLACGKWRQLAHLLHGVEGGGDVAVGPGAKRGDDGGVDVRGDGSLDEAAEVVVALVEEERPRPEHPLLAAGTSA